MGPLRLRLRLRRHSPLHCRPRPPVPYVWVASKAELGGAAGTKRPTSVVLLHCGGKGAPAALAAPDALEKMQEIFDEIKALA